MVTSAVHEIHHVLLTNPAANEPVAFTSEITTTLLLNVPWPALSSDDSTYAHIPPSSCTKFAELMQIPAGHEWAVLPSRFEAIAEYVAYYQVASHLLPSDAFAISVRCHHCSREICITLAGIRRPISNRAYFNSTFECPADAGQTGPVRPPQIQTLCTRNSVQLSAFQVLLRCCKRGIELEEEQWDVRDTLESGFVPVGIVLWRGCPCRSRCRERRSQSEGRPRWPRFSRVG